MFEGGSLNLELIVDSVIGWRTVQDVTASNLKSAGIGSVSFARIAV